MTSALPKFATRLNSFASRTDLFWPGLKGKPTTVQMIERASTVSGLSTLDLNYPDHMDQSVPREIAKAAGDLGLSINGLAMRYYTDPAFRIGAFTNPDPVVRRKAIDLTKRGIDAAAEIGAPLMTLWLGQDGFDYAFQADYDRLWEMEIDGIREVADHDPSVMVSLEYKPNEPRAYALLPDVSTTLLAIADVGRPNLGVTLDFAHVLYADEQPAFAAALVARHSRLLGIHLNDAYGKRDDGLMVGAVHTIQTIELIHRIRRIGYTGALYFDTFPDVSGLDPVKECEANIATVTAMYAAAEALEASNRLADAMERQDAVAAQQVVQQTLLGGRVA